MAESLSRVERHALVRNPAEWEARVTAFLEGRACFQAQQAAEKAVKAMLYARGAEDVLGHSVRELLRAATAAAPALASLDDAAMHLDRLYIPTRYPNGLPGGIPADAFSAEDATEAISHAEARLAAARTNLG